MGFFCAIVSVADDNCTDNHIRLLYGSHDGEGTVEICIDGIRGTVLHTDWDSLDAAVVCRQLGLPSLGTTFFSDVC